MTNQLIEEMIKEIIRGVGYYSDEETIKMIKALIFQVQQEERKRWEERIKERIEVADLCIEASEQGQDLGGGFTPEEEMRNEMVVKVVLEGLLEAIEKIIRE
jgi:hypothetical protein